MNNSEKNVCSSMGRWGILTIALVLALGVLGWATLEQRKSIMKTAAEMKNCSTFSECVEKAGLSGVLEKDGPFSVFVPTNDAFEKIPADQLKSLLNNKSALTALLLYHMVPKKLSVAEMENLKNCLTCTVPQTSIACSERKYGQGNYTGAPVPCTNGVIFFIDSVQIPAFLNTSNSANTNGTPAVVEDTQISVVEAIDNTSGKSSGNKADAKSGTDSKESNSDSRTKETKSDSNESKADMKSEKSSGNDSTKSPEKK